MDIAGRMRPNAGRKVYQPAGHAFIEIGPGERGTAVKMAALVIYVRLPAKSSNPSTHSCIRAGPR
jgi:hypothetical protein